MASNPKKDDGWGGWIAIIILFSLSLWPVGLFLLFIKLFGGESKKQQTAPPLQTEVRTQTQAPASVGIGRSRKAAQKVVKSPVEKASTAKRLTVFGVILALAGGWMVAAPLTMLAHYDTFRAWAGIYLWELLQYSAMGIAGLGMLWKGRQMSRAMKRYPKYLSVLGDREAMDVAQLARTLGYSRRLVEKDLQTMIDKGYFGGKAYLNVELGYLFRSGRAEAAYGEKVAAENAPPPPREAEEGYSRILRNIRRANDRIADPILSAKIDRLEEIAARIFRAVEEDPKKRGRIDTFLNYYLPTTQKLLDSYAEFESTGVEGENLRLAKSRIEATMDSIVAGFEHQLDELYKGDAMDVDSDIRVMEVMLYRDTASVEKDFGLGGGAAVQWEEES